MRTQLVSIFIVCISVPACKEPAGSEVNPPTFHGDVAPILSQKCGSCHTEGGMNPNTRFEDAEAASILAPILAGQIESGAMPPFYAEESESLRHPTLDPANSLPASISHRSDLLHAYQP